MTIPFLADIERLITERGSAAVLRERIALAGDKYDALERQAASLQKEIVDLESEKNALRLNNKELNSQIENLTKPEVHSVRLEEVKEKILVAISEQDDITDGDLAYRLSISRIAAELHLDELKAIKFIYPVLCVGQQHTPWQLDQEGKKYLVRHHLA